MPYPQQTDGPRHFHVAAYVHYPGDRACDKCRHGFPWRCPNGGLVHAELAYDNKQAWYALACDTCRRLSSARRPNGTESPHRQGQAPWPDARCLQEGG